MGDVTGPVGREEYARAVRLSRVAMLAAIAAAAVALLIAFGVIRLQGVMQSTEEPPIRVRNGSEDVMALASDTFERDAQGNDKNWHLKNGTYNHKHLNVVFYYQGGTCKGNFASVDKLTVEYVNDASTNSVEITQPGHKIGVKSKNDLKPNSKQDVVSFGPPELGYISKVFLNNNTEPFCTFTNDQDLGAIDVVDW